MEAASSSSDTTETAQQRQLWKVWLIWQPLVLGVCLAASLLGTPAPPPGTKHSVADLVAISSFVWVLIIGQILWLFVIVGISLRRDRELTIPKAAGLVVALFLGGFVGISTADRSCHVGDAVLRPFPDGTTPRDEDEWSRGVPT